MQYLFQLGRQPEISTAEIQAVFSLWQISFNKVFSDSKYLIVETKQELDANKLMQRLGGTIKIAQEISFEKQSPIRPTSLISPIVSYLDQSVPSGKIQFSLSGDNAEKIALAVKKELKSLGRSVRYIKANNTATILHNSLVEKQTDMTLVNKQVFITQAIQPIEELGKRDFDRPGRDAKSGMLPPKLAKIMINLAQAKQDATILDPFCGSGTILMEAALMGYENLIGSDISDKAITDSKKNLEWLCEQDNNVTMKQCNNVKFYTADSTKLPDHLKPNSIDAIVTEPYLGNPLKGTETKDQLERQASELGKLYVNVFKSFQKILKKDGTIIFIIPCFRFQDEWVKIDCVKEIKKLGFKPSGDPLLYWRAGQKLGREIWRFGR